MVPLPRTDLPFMRKGSNHIDDELSGEKTRYVRHVEARRHFYEIQAHDLALGRDPT